ncbi:MAG TPA: hypothetical protein PKA28_08505 [Methylomusa anaerophila]|nr:hypothetical protein [Methylomusa anaerophila]HML88475.1 hypothetical protein [Methylomusa anaerophila]
MYDGQGILIDKGKGTYTGEFKNSRFHGFGRFTANDGSIYEGTFANGILNGDGSITYPDGSKFSGKFVNGTPVAKPISIRDFAINGISLGSLLADASAKLGNPLSENRLQQRMSIYQMSNNVEIVAMGGRVVRLTLKGASSLSTARGIKIGDNLTKVKLFYGNGYRENRFQNTNSINCDFGDKGIRFIMDSADIVQQIDIQFYTG